MPFEKLELRPRSNKVQGLYVTLRGGSRIVLNARLSAEAGIDEGDAFEVFWDKDTRKVRLMRVPPTEIQPEHLRAVKVGRSMKSEHPILIIINAELFRLLRIPPDATKRCQAVVARYRNQPVIEFAYRKG